MGAIAGALFGTALVKAGLIPAIGRGAIPGSEKWFVVELLPGARPVDELEIALTRVAANEHARFGIRVNAVAPGFTLTAMVDRDEAMMPGWKQSQIDGTPMHRGADPVRP